MTYQEAYDRAVTLLSEFSPPLASRIVLDGRDVLILFPGHQRLLGPPQLLQVDLSREDFEAYLCSREETDELESFVRRTARIRHDKRAEDGCEEEN